MRARESERISRRVRHHVTQLAGTFKRVFFQPNLVFDADRERQKHFWVDVGKPVAAQIEMLELFKPVESGTVDVRDPVVSEIERRERVKRRERMRLYFFERIGSQIQNLQTGEPVENARLQEF